MTNATIIEEQKIRPSDIYEERQSFSQFFMGQWEDGSIQGFLKCFMYALCWHQYFIF